MLDPVIIPLSQGKIALIDAEDAPLVSRWRWYAHKDHNTFYAVRGALLSNGKKTLLRMHRVILGVTDTVIKVDHRDCDGLNNRRKNLRVATSRQNLWNLRKQPGTSSQFKGVSWNKRDKKWQAHIRRPGKQKHLGYFNDEVSAASAYDAAARTTFGEFARLNFPYA